MSDDQAPKRKQTSTERRAELIVARDMIHAEIIEEYVHRRGLSYSYLSGSWTYKGATKAKKTLISDLKYHMPEANREMIEGIITHMEQVAADNAQANRAERAINLSAQPGEEDDTYLRQWYEALTGRSGTSIEIEADLWAMKKWLWQVLRNALGKPVKWQIVPSIWSRRQGSGKTFLVEEGLLSSWSPHWLPMRAYQLSQDFFAPVLSRTLIGYLDDFAGPGHGEERLAIWKQYITSTKIMRRQMYDNTCFEADNPMSIITTSNLSPDQQVKDGSGDRRMWYIRASETGIQHDRPRGQLTRDLMADKPRLEKIWKAVDCQVESIQDIIPDEVGAYMDREQYQERRSEGCLEGWVNSWTVPAKGHSITMKTDGRPSLNRYASLHGFERIEGGDRAICKQLQALGFEAKQPGGNVRLVDRRLIENEPVDRSLRVVKA